MLLGWIVALRLFDFQRPSAEFGCIAGLIVVSVKLFDC
jgi:hypothetical protein